MSTIAVNLDDLRQQIIIAEQRYGRHPGSTQLVAVSKTQPVSAIHEAVVSGQRVFGENYIQEAIPKIKALKQFDLEWHFIGSIQSNKTHEIAENFQWVDSIDRLKIAERLNEQRPKNLPPLQVCIQINIDDEASKSGISPDLVPELAKAISKLPQLKLRGLMTIPKQKDNFEQQRSTFYQLAEILRDLNESGLNLDTLSMGMSNDFEAAIAERATHLRIGTAIFGQRD